MKCIYCGLAAGFLRWKHQECHDIYKQLLIDREEVINNYALGIIERSVAKNRIMDITEHPFIQQEFNSFVKRIKTGETIIRHDSLVIVDEYKNHCSFVRIGLSYNRYPKYTEGVKTLDSCDVLITDKQINIIPNSDNVRRLSINMKKIIALNKDEDVIIIEVKTTSAVPHRVSLKNITDSESVYYLIKCFTKL